MNGKNPVVYMIGGPNGAGKTTAAMNLMPKLIGCYEYVNADSIAAGLSPFRPAKISLEAGRLMIKRIRDLADKREDFAFETTMASRSFVRFLKECRKNQYQVHLVYIWLYSTELAIARVAQRVATGGHYVSDDIVRSRYYHGLENFFKLYMPVADTWALYDNSQLEIKLVAEKYRQSQTNIMQPKLWKVIAEGYV